MDNNQIVILSGPHESTKLIYNSLKSDFHVERVIIEDKVQLIQFLRKRVKRLGLIHVTGQVLFRLLIQFPLSVLSKNRMQKIKERYGLDNAPIDKNIVSRVTSANSPKTIELLKSIQPKIVILNGTRIISEEVLKCTNAVFVNIHAGITPRYRGSHGAYWAIVEDNLEECGVTVHIVDTGIDTGTIIGQERIYLDKSDNFATYPTLQLAVGISILKKYLPGLLENRFKASKSKSNISKVWSHPTFWEYIYYLIMKKAR